MKKIIYISFFSLFLIGCGGGGGSTTKSEANIADSSVEIESLQKGYFIDSKVEGLKYVCGDIIGYTDTEGAFYYPKGSSCKFYANKILIKEAKDLFNGVYVVDVDKSIVEFLLTLDKDGNFNNGIQIPDSAEEYMPEELPDNSDIESMHAKLQKNIQTYDGHIPSEDEVLEHIESTLLEHRPLAVAQGYEVLYNYPILIKLQGKDNQTSKLKFKITKQPQHGKLTGVAPNIKYTPNKNFIGEDSFSFIVNDYYLDSKESNITLNVTKEPSSIYVSQKGMVVDLGDIDINKNIYLQDPSLSLYLVFTNYSDEVASIDLSPKNIEQNADTKLLKTVLEDRRDVSILKSDIEKFNNSVDLENLDIKDINDTILDNEKVDKVLDSSIFYLTKDRSESTDAQLMLQKSVETQFGIKNLKIWVSKENIQDLNCTKNCIDTESLNQLADKFLKDGDNNDIYDLITNVYGKEWNSDAHDVYSVLIENNEEINILLTDLNKNSSSQNVVVGFYYAKDNFTKNMYDGSNERLMIYLDANVYSNIDPYWKNEIYRTLAHEFQHMINFYQKSFIYGSGSETWLNEMLSETTEDLVSVNLDLIGPREIEASDPTASAVGISVGRYPYFNNYGLNMSLNSWKYNIYDYSKVNAFGAFLTRKYGAKVLHEIMHNSYRGYEAIEYGVSSVLGYEVKIEDILQEWAAAIVLSDEYSLVNSVYNANDYIVSEFNDVVYKLGSINLFNYSPQPNIANSVESVNSIANYYYKINVENNDPIKLKISSSQDSVKVLLIAK